MSNQVYANKEKIYNVVKPTQENFREVRLTPLADNTGATIPYLAGINQLSGGKYLLCYNGKGQGVGAADVLTRIDFLVDGITENFVVLSSALGANFLFSYTDVFTIGPGPHSFAINFASEVPPANAQLSNALISVIKIAD